MTSQHNTGTHPFYIGMYIHICTHIYVHIYTSQKECLCIFMWYIFIYIYIYLNIDMYIHICIDIYVYIHICIHIPQDLEALKSAVVHDFASLWQEWQCGGVPITSLCVIERRKGKASL